MILDDLEIELRKLPGVRAAGFNQREDLLLVQLHVEGRGPGLSLQATRIAARHSERPVAVELVRWRTLEAPSRAPEPDLSVPLAEAEEAAAVVAEHARGPATTIHPEPASAQPAAPAAGTPESVPPRERVRLLAVLTFPDTDELEVHLTLAARRAIGRAPASRGLVGAVEATIDALRAFAPSLEYSPRWARALEAEGAAPFLVACELTDSAGTTRHGVASGTSPIEAAARSALHALNRTLTRVLEPA